MSTQRSSNDLPLTNRTILTSLARGIDGPVMLAIAAVFPKVFRGEIAGENMRAAGALDGCVSGYIKIDLMGRAIDPNHAWGE